MSESNFSSQPPRKRLPVNPSEVHLDKQAKRRVKIDPSIQLAQAQLDLAHEYGCKNWAERMHIVETMNRGAGRLSGPSEPQQPLPRAANQNDIAAVRTILALGRIHPARSGSGTGAIGAEV